jgi:hypothetical protein
MPDAQPMPDPAERARQKENDILYALTHPEEIKPLWTIEELACEVEEYDVESLVKALQRAGLVHRTSDGHVFASHAAVRHIQLVGWGVI